MRRLLLIANPSASGFTGAALRAVESKLSEGFELDTTWPNGPAESRQAAADAAADGYAAVVAMGGDGVVHHVANGLAFTGTSLGVIPTGTTNVVARILGIPMNPEKAAARLLTGHRKMISLAHIATESPLAARSEYAVFALGLGLDADVVAISDRRPAAKYHFSSANFAAIATKQVFSNYRRKRPDMLVECGGQRVHAATVLVQVHNLYTYWGRAPLRLTPDPGDGLTAVAIEQVSVLRTVGVAARGLLKRSLQQQGTHVFHDVEKLIVHAEPGAQFQADGELLGTAESVEITPAYDAMSVIIPNRE
ncbi:MAG: diacylglycerol kinase family protein [Acidimicrobiia bacterium]|nr:diacylglycerol kinase family protein [Acidimicrobiia bacterium]MDX2467035.1 diacylglycerol kinase family protein [Acidimicrobiia bacterium]